MHAQERMIEHAVGAACMVMRRSTNSVAVAHAVCMLVCHCCRVSSARTSLPSASAAMSSSAASSSSSSSFLSTFLRANDPRSMSRWALLERAAAYAFVAVVINKIRKIDLSSVIKVNSKLKGEDEKREDVIPGAAGALQSRIDSETTAAVAGAFPAALNEGAMLRIPAESAPYDEILARMRGFQQHEPNPRKGRVFGYMYEVMDHDLESFIQKAFVMYMHENALNPTAFPVLRKFEVEVVQMTLNLFNAPAGAVGTMTSGGTESLLLAIKSYRDRARALSPHITRPEAVMCCSVHVAVPKACKYFDVVPVFVPMDPESMRMDIEAARRAITANTILLMGSAPQYPHGVVDPITELGALAIEKKLPLHVDACMGGFLLPWVERLGLPVPLWDFRVSGVTSISADIHKYGYSAKGASTLSWLNQEYRQYQFFAFAAWPGGMFVSPSLLGTRPGGAIAAAWAALVGIGEKGYMTKARALMDCASAFRRAIESNPELRVLGQPAMSILSFAPTDAAAKAGLNVFAIADVMEKAHGFKVECQQHPSCLHVTLTPPHQSVVAEFGAALKASVAEVIAHPELASQGNAATYGIIAKIPSAEIADQFLVSFLDKVLKPSPNGAAAAAGKEASNSSSGSGSGAK